MSINSQTLCYNCFQEKPQGEGPCPYCGFDLRENEEQYPVALKAGAILKQRYLAGGCWARADSALPMWPGIPS